MPDNDPRKAARWWALVDGGMSPDEATATVEREFAGTAQAVLAPIDYRAAERQAASTQYKQNAVVLLRCCCSAVKVLLQCC